MIIAYKMCRRTSDGVLTSSWVNPPARIEYKLGEWVQPNPVFIEKGYPLFVAHKLEELVDMGQIQLSDPVGFPVFECECESPAVLPEFRCKNEIASGKLPKNLRKPPNDSLEYVGYMRVKLVRQLGPAEYSHLCDA